VPLLEYPQLLVAFILGNYMLLNDEDKSEEDLVRVYTLIPLAA